MIAKKKLIFGKLCLMTVACLLLSTFCSSCQDDVQYEGNTRVEEGLPASISLKIKVNDLSVHSRSIADEPNAYYCDNMWVGIYSNETGKCVEHFYVTDVEDNLEQSGEYYLINHDLTSANNVSIYAVANVDVNTGIGDVSQYGGSESKLLDLLNAADTYEKFQKVCVLRPDATDVNVYATTLTMSGWYDKDGVDYGDPTKVDAVNIAPGSNSLTGYVYLRRLISYNKFEIYPGKYVNLTLNSWKVCNVPAGASAIESATGNVADGYTGSASFYNSTLTSRHFTATETTNAAGNTGHSFEFYQFENKHNAVPYAGSGDDHVGIDSLAVGGNYYIEREREFKDSNNDADNTVTNTGIYRSLVSDRNASDLSNNNASYVVLNASIDYYVDADNFDAETAEPIDPNSDVKKIHRTASVNYTIHLGYCDGASEYAKAKDFNCRRNSRYTYTVTINGVKNVVVEAKRNGENQPGAEGWVSDEIGDFEELDAHYCEFNISLTDEQRKNLSYRITAPYAGKKYVYSRIGGTVSMTAGMNEEQYSWVKFYPTSGEKVLAEYCGGKGKNDKGEGTGLWTIDEICGLTKQSPYDADSDGKRWYTVFVNEYVYTFDDDNSGAETSWHNYVNQDDRLVEFLLSTDKSADTESTYSYNMYAFAQKSIQSYYQGSETGIGIEHTEETYCLNMTWQLMENTDMQQKEREYGNLDEDGHRHYDFANGRYNLYHYLLEKQDTLWANVANQTTPGHVDAGTSNGCSHPDADYPVFMPKGSSSYYANSICMNRNRDLNGDGAITPDEVRWYLPTSAQYIQIAIAQSELPDPIMRFTDYSKDYFKKMWEPLAANHDNRNRYGTYNYHYITSDYQYYWAEQAVNTGNTPFGGYNASGSVCNTARCVRNLGTDQSKTPVFNEPEVGYAYVHDANARTFTQKYFSDNVLRGYNYGGIAPHDVSSPSARPYKKFEYAQHLCVNLKDKYVSFQNGYWSNKASNDSVKLESWTNSLRLNGICGQYTQEADKSDLGSWRMPSAYELALMWIENIPQNTPTMESGYLNVGTNNSYYLSATHDYFVSYDYRNYADYNQMYLGYNDTGDRKVLALDCLGNTIRLRCVRDVR
jgi:hypothetical protein